MRVTLVHNPEAGSGDHVGSELLTRLRDAGHEAEYASTEAAELSRALSSHPDLVLAAGGDGTVGAVARLMAARAPDVPLAILPVGTANNLARSLGVHGTVDQVVNGLGSSARRRLDIGTVSAPWGTVRFVESAGVGLFGVMLRDAEREERELASSRADRPDHHESRLERVMRGAQAHHWRVEADGEDLSGEFLLAAVLNIAFVGPALELAPSANASDGQLDLLLVGEDHREALGAYLSAYARGEAATLSIETRRVRRVRLEWNAEHGHVDDHLWPEAPATREAASSVAALATIDASGPPVSILIPEP